MKSWHDFFVLRMLMNSRSFLPLRMDAIREADESKLIEAYEQYRNILLRHCRYRIATPEEAEDLVQEVFLHTWEYLKRGHTIDSPKTFLFRVASNLLIDAHRRRKRRGNVSLEVLLEKGFDPGKDDMEGVRQTVDVWHMLQKCKKQREHDFLVMRYVRGMGLPEIASRAGISSNAVAVMLHRAVKVLSRSVVPSRHLAIG